MWKISGLFLYISFHDLNHLYPVFLNCSDSPNTLTAFAARFIDFLCKNWYCRGNQVSYPWDIKIQCLCQVVGVLLYETNLDGSIGSGNFSVRDYLSLIRKDSSTHMHGLAVYVKEGLPFAQDLSLENCEFLLMFSTDFTSLTVCTNFDSMSSNIVEVVSISPSANVFCLWRL